MDIPDPPGAVPVSLDPATMAVLVLDLTDLSCGKVPAAKGSLVAVRRFLDRARSEGVPVMFSLGRAPQEVHPDLGRRDDEPIVKSSANKFFRTDLEERLRGIHRVVVLGTAANGAVLYTSFAACALGLTVVVPEDAISSRTAIATQTARWQLLNQPGFMNERNTALQPQAVTLSRTDLISFAPPA
ncbi:MAG TPA: isochorismatase family cysteine hydrolase [Candidatus Limnocylindria bacterium]|nr:isochorismatase family cysteine hydrolase [Candidatus Limnocylindria bacterium]